MPYRINIAHLRGADWGTLATLVLALACVAFLVFQV